MGVFDNVKIEQGVELPEWPYDEKDVGWQTKDIGRPAMQTYKISDDGRLMRKEQNWREKTQEEKDEMAREYTDGEAQTWEEWDEMDTALDEPLPTWEQTVDEEWWVDENRHGSFEFHTVLKWDPIEESREENGIPQEYETDEWWSYEARFTKGDLDEIVLLEYKDYNED